MSDLISIADPMRTISPIRDPIHNYTAFTIFEREIIDSAFFQRLHFVLQNSAAYSVYPANKNSRFVHSLGVAHLCGRMFIHGLKNSHPDNLKTFISDASKFISSTFRLLNITAQQQTDVALAWRNLINNSSRFQHKPANQSPIDLKSIGDMGHLDPLFVINTLWLSLRICGLVHDIGHLPMSHLFEDALEDLGDIAVLCGLSEDKIKILGSLYSKSINDAFDPNDSNPEESLRHIAHFLEIDTDEISNLIRGSKIHEVRSLRIFDIIRNNSSAKYSKITANTPGALEYRKLILFISNAILFASRKGIRPKNSFLAALRGIVAGELDADRLDYTMRDPRSSGLELGTFDVDRIVSSITLCYLDENPIFAVSEKAVSAVESFFHQRYLMYSTLVYHRTAMRTKSILKELIGRLIVFCIDCPGHPISEICERAGFVSFKRQNGIISRNKSGQPEVKEIVPSSFNHLVSFDDSRLRSALFEIWSYLSSQKEVDRSEGWILLLSETFLFRREEHVVSFGKGSLSTENDRKYLDILDVNPFLISQSDGRPKLIKFVKDLRKHISEETEGRVALLFSETKPKVYGGYDLDKPDKAIHVTVDSEGALRRLETLSPYIAIQKSLAERERDFAISFVGRDLREGTDLPKCREAYEAILRECARLKREAIKAD